MSTCISKHGEYSEHTVTVSAYCDWCGAFDEEAAIREAQSSAWSEGFHAGHQTARGVNEEYPEYPANPYED